MGDLGIGRTPLREAVKRLALENLVDVQPRRGTFVSAGRGRRHRQHHRGARRARGLRRRARRAPARPRGTRDAPRRSCTRSSSSTAPDDQDWLMRFDERIHRFTWEAARQPVSDRDARALLHALAAHLVPGARPRARPRPRGPRPDAAARGGARSKRPPRAHDHARARARLPAGDPRRVQFDGLRPPGPCHSCQARSSQRARVSARTVPWPPALEVSRHREEHLRGGEGVALGRVRAVRGQAERRGDRREAARARIALAALDAQQPPEHRRVDDPARQGAPGLLEKRALHPACVHHRYPPGHLCRQRRQRLRRPRRPGEVASRKRWISIEALVDVVAGTDETVNRLRRDDPGVARSGCRRTRSPRPAAGRARWSRRRSR